MWIVKDTSKLEGYGFTLVHPYEEAQNLTSWQKTVHQFQYAGMKLRTVYLDVPQIDETEDGGIIEARHKLYLEDTSPSAEDEAWEYALPTIAKMHQDGVIEWRS